jgi:hypothetical protein
LLAAHSQARIDAEHNCGIPSQSNPAMSVIVCAVTAMSVALIYSNWRSHEQKNQTRQKLLRERVAYMLWVMANGMPEPR